MPKKLNVKFLLWTLTAVLLAAVGVHLLHESQVHDHAEMLRAQAVRAADRGDDAEAITFFSHYLSYQPEDADALSRYARVLEKLPATPSLNQKIVQLLEQAVHIDPARHDLRERLVVLLIRLERFAPAAEHLQALTVAFPKRGDLEHELGVCQEALKDYAESEASLRRAIQKSPAQLESYVLLAELLRDRLQQPDAAAAAIDAMVAANPKSPRALLARARYHRARGEDAEAEADVQGAARIAPKDANVLLALVELAQEKGETKQARKALAHGLELHPKDSRFHRALAALEVRAGRRVAAVTILRRGLKALPDNGPLVPLLADLLIDEGKLDEAGALIARLRKASGPAGVADYLQARVLMQSSRWTEACDLLTKVRNRPGVKDWLVQIEICVGQCHERLGELDQSVTAYRRAVQRDGSVALARLGLGAALLEAGNVEQARAELQRVADMVAPPAEVWALLARAQLSHNLHLPEGARDWASVELALNRMQEAQPKSPQLPILRAELLAGQGHSDRALDLLAKAVAAQPKEILVRAALADLARRYGKAELARATLERAQKELPDSLELRLARLRYAVTLDPRQAQAALQALAKQPRDGLKPTEALLLVHQLAEGFARTGDRTGAARLWRQLAAQRPTDLHSRVKLLDLALQEGRDDRAREILAEIRRIEDDNGALWRAGEAARRLALARRGHRGELGEVRKLLAEAKTRRKDWSRLALLEAAADEVEGKWNSAAAHYLQALELGEREPAALARAARLLYQCRKVAGADQAIRLLEEQVPLSRAQARLAADVALAQESGANRALALARQAVSPDSRDYRDYLWLAHVQSAAGLPGEAEKTLRHAVRIAGGIPDVWVALVRQLARTGNRPEAEKALKDATRRLPRDRAKLGLARCEEALGRIDRAEEHYRKAVTAHPRDFVAVFALADFYRRADEPAKAEPHWRTLIDPAMRAPEEYVVRARRELAIALAATKTDATALAEALALLNRNVQVLGSSPADSVARAFVLATRPERREEAQQLLERLPRRETMPAAQQFVVVRTYAAVGNEPEALNLMLGLLALERDNPQFVAYHLRGLLRDGNLEEAGRVLTELEGLEPHSTRTRSLQQAYRKAMPGQ